MSYDLYLHRDKGVSGEEFSAYFSGRPNYRCENKQACYENEATGVYFFFDLAGDEQEPDEEGPPHSIAFNLNFYRPHFFALEAAPEVKAVVDYFGFKVSDPQNDGMGEGPFTIEGFLRGWNRGNEFGYQAILGAESPPEKVWSRPGSELEAIWRWNVQRDKVQQSHGDNIFVPRVLWGTLDGELFSMAIWTDGIPSLLPKVEMLVIGRDELAPTRFFRKSTEPCFVAPHEFDRLLAPYDAKSWPLPARMPGYKVASPDLRKFIQALKVDSRQLQILPVEAVLNRELVEKHRKQP